MLEKLKGTEKFIFYDAEVIFEANISVKGCCYLTIFGKHANGYFCCIPNWGKGCEMAEPNDTYYNACKLTEVGFKKDIATNIAEQIKEIAGISCLWSNVGIKSK